MRLTNKNYDNDVLEIQKTRKVVRPDGGLGNYSQWDYNNDLWNYVKVREDIEEELGIELLTLFKALKDGIIACCDNPFGGKRNVFVNLTPDRLSVEYKWKCLRKGKNKFYFKDYGKTWALTKEELLWTNEKIKNNDYQIE